MASSELHENLHEIVIPNDMTEVMRNIRPKKKKKGLFQSYGQSVIQVTIPDYSYYTIRHQNDFASVSLFEVLLILKG